MQDMFTRTKMLIGEANLEKLKRSNIAVFGIGGVGSYTVEALVRAGIESINLIDNDVISYSNINRQIHALSHTVGRSKVEVMKKRICAINPNANIKTYNEFYSNKNRDNLIHTEYDYVIDAIDTTKSKIDLISTCKEKNIPIISSMGTGNKLNPTMLEIDDIYNTSVCPLARVVRKELRKRNIKKLKVVYSKEKPILENNIFKNDQKEKRRCIPSSISFVPSVAGLIIASEVVKDIIKN